MDFIQYIGLTLGIAVVLIILIFAFSGPSASKATNRRLVSVRDRHLVGASNIEARMKSIVSTTFNPASQKGGSILPSPALIKLRLTQTGKDWTLKQYLLASLGLTIGVGLTALVQGAPPLLSVLAGALAGLGLPHFAVGYLIKKRSAGFNTKFPDALELMVRGLRSGLPISETLGIVGAEIDGSLGDEFQAVSDKMKIGRSMEDALQDTADRIGTPEVQFFCITLAIQRETGGNLAETLSNLAEVLRKRAQMKLKISAMSSESKASAYIIGSLPFIVFALIYTISPDYMGKFFVDERLMAVGGGGMVWMGIGGFVMSRMIAFEI
jgi:tight adherence protein B